MKKITKKILGFALFLFGATLLIRYQTGITGSFLSYEPRAYAFAFWVGFALLALGIIIFSTASIYRPSPTLPTLEKRLIPISSSIKKNSSLLRLTEDAVRDETVEREMNHLIKELSRGNFEAGLGHPGHIEGTKINYLRGRNGARLYYQRKGENSYDIVAKSAKGRNQEQVIDKLKEIY